MYVSKEVDYALRTMIALAGNESRPLTDREISKSYKIPYNFLALALPKLLRHGLVTLEKHDKKEAYRIAKKPRALTVLEVLKAVNGPIELIAVNKTDRGQMEPYEPMMAMWDGLTAEVEKYLASATLAGCALAEKNHEK